MTWRAFTAAVIAAAWLLAVGMRVFGCSAMRFVDLLLAAIVAALAYAVWLAVSRHKPSPMDPD